MWCEDQIIFTFVHFSARVKEFELVVGSTDVDLVREGDVIVVEVISFGDEEAVHVNNAKLF